MIATISPIAVHCVDVMVAGVPRLVQCKDAIAATRLAAAMNAAVKPSDPSATQRAAFNAVIRMFKK